MGERLRTSPGNRMDEEIWRKLLWKGTASAVPQKGAERMFGL
jgi:hypothetical protein